MHLCLNYKMSFGPWMWYDLVGTFVKDIDYIKAELISQVMLKAIDACCVAQLNGDLIISDP